MPSKSVWITYAWVDNAQGDVDFTAQELIRAGLTVKLDRWNLTAGKRLWDQIGSFIVDPSLSDGWILYATQASLGSEACKEELYYALERAIASRGTDYPVIAIFPATVDSNLIPPAIRSRLYVSLCDPDWKERIVAAVERRQPTVNHAPVSPYQLTVHRQDGHQIVEVRPRAGTWSPFLAAIPISEKQTVSPTLAHGPAGSPPMGCMLMNCGEQASSDGQHWILFAGNEATPTQSYYISCKVLPSILVFGVNGRAPQYTVRF